MLKSSYSSALDETVDNVKYQLYDILRDAFNNGIDYGKSVAIDEWEKQEKEKQKQKQSPVAALISADEEIDLLLLSNKELQTLKSLYSNSLEDIENEIHQRAAIAELEEQEDNYNIMNH